MVILVLKIVWGPLKRREFESPSLERSRWPILPQWSDRKQRAPLNPKAEETLIQEEKGGPFQPVGRYGGGPTALSEAAVLGALSKAIFVIFPGFFVAYLPLHRWLSQLQLSTLMVRGKKISG